MIIEYWLDHLTTAEINSLCEVVDFIQYDCSLSEQKYLKRAFRKLFDLCVNRAKRKKGEI